jgi:chromate reductase
MKKKILFVIGSLRKKSFNKQVAQYVESLIGDRAEVKYLHYSDIPFMNQDIEFPTPAEVARVREEVMAADVLWVFTPEYNYSYPALVKNLFDWLSRPMKTDDPERHTAIEGKKVALTGIGGKNQTKDCREKLTSMLDFLRARVFDKQVGLMVNVEAWGDDVVRLTPEQKQQLQAQTEETLN